MQTRKTTGNLELCYSYESSAQQWNTENSNLETIDAAVTELQQSSGVAVAHQVGPEVPTGAVDGMNRDYTLANVPNPSSSVWGFLNNGGIFYGDDFTVDANVVTMTQAPSGGNTVRFFYRY
jgi:hypothetical protein